METTFFKRFTNTNFKKNILICFLWVIICCIYFLPILPSSKVWAPLDIQYTLLEPWAESDKIEVKNAYPYDAISQYIPYDYSVYKSLREDGYIGWNPYVHNGTAINENHMICPGSLRHVFYRFLPFWDAWDIGRMFHIFLAGLGMIFLLNVVKIPHSYHLLGAISFAFSAQFIVWLHTDVISSGCCWSPWILGSLISLKKHIISEIGTRKIIVPFIFSSLFIGLGLRNGFLHTAFFNFTMILLILGYEIYCYIKTKNKQSSKTILFYTLAIIIGTIIALPILLDVIPPALEGGHELIFHYGIQTIPSTITNITPYIGGSPQGFDPWKFVDTGLFDIKFGGGTIVIVALLGTFIKNIKTLPKIIFLTFFIIPFTPLSTWYYHRCGILMCLAMAWLAIETLRYLESKNSERFFKWVKILFTIFVISWMLISLVMFIFKDQILVKFTEIAISSLPANKIDRTPWMEERASIFFNQFLCWNLFNVTTIISLIIGIHCASKLTTFNKKSSLVAIVTTCCFVEMLLFAYRWMPVSNTPQAKGSPYNNCEWVDEFKKHTDNQGSVYFINANKFDYMQLNTPSAHNIYQATGYESVQPKKLTPINVESLDPIDFANAGISHISTHPHNNIELPIGWNLVTSNQWFKLHKNNSFTSKYFVTTADNEIIPVKIIKATPSSREFIIPKGATSFTALESYHKNWKFSLDGITYNHCQQSTNGYSSIHIELQPISYNYHLHIKFEP